MNMLPRRLLAALLFPLLLAGCVVAPVGSAGVVHDSGDTRVEFRVSSYPDLVLVPGLPVYYAPRLGYNYFFSDGLYWVLEGDRWYSSYWYGGPWRYVAIEYVPVYVLRVPVYYYRRPPAWFGRWHPQQPPRWSDRYGRDFAVRHPGWQRWDPRVVPPPAPRPDYQRHYRGRDYPRTEARQRELRERHYRQGGVREPGSWHGPGTAGEPGAPRGEAWQRRQQEAQAQREAWRAREREQAAREWQARDEERQARGRPGAERPPREWRGEWRSPARAPVQPGLAGERQGGPGERPAAWPERHGGAAERQAGIPVRAWDGEVAPPRRPEVQPPRRLPATQAATRALPERQDAKPPRERRREEAPTRRRQGQSQEQGRDEGRGEGRGGREAPAAAP